MKKLPIPEVDDLDVLKKMKDNDRIASQPYIADEYDVMRLQYISYAGNDGDPWACTGGQISEELKDKLEYHYTHPYSDLKYIKELRSKGSPDVCPLCGSSKTATLDHFLPQADYPEWIVYSKNLVPACDCNSKRRNDVKGSNINERVLHPYYDECLSERIVCAEFKGDLELPDIDIIPLPSRAVSEETVRFHIDTVVKRSTVIPWMEAKWQSMRRRPKNIMSAIPKNAGVLTFDEMEEYILETLEDKDSEHQTLNNWYSMFIFGIYCSDEAKNWLLNIHNGIITGRIDPLQN